MTCWLRTRPVAGSMDLTRSPTPTWLKGRCEPSAMSTSVLPGKLKRLGVSPRTAHRIAADLMERLEARSRFEAGVHAVQDGWLPSSR
ncbi:hypothetical protein GCM10010521_22600 [Streptomyces rameus]|uniref:Uncharacterized protein n=1 Tax=Streptomyces rameus TaxID=68261 RepID=A0ABP6N483_9ACTN